MSLTLSELKERIAHECDEVTILELLEIDGEMLVERFEDEIENRYDKLLKEFENPLSDTQGTENEPPMVSEDRAYD